MSSPWARRAGDVAPYHGCHGACGHGVRAWRTLCMLVGADVPGGPRTRGVPDVVPVGAARRGRRALPWMPWCVCMGAGMAWAWCVLCMMVGADVPGGPRPRCRSRCRSRGRGAPGTSRPTMDAMVRADMVCMVCIVHVGRGRRPRRPASPMSSPMSSPWARRAEDVAPSPRRVNFEKQSPCLRASARSVLTGRMARPRRPASPMSSPMSSPAPRSLTDCISRCALHFS